MNQAKAVTSSGAAACCFICKSSTDDEVLYGKFYSKWRLRVHYYCLLLTSSLVQNGEDDEVGIFGFLQEDIKNEEARIRNQKCYICKERYANVWCCAKKCFRTFHTVCGRENGCLSHFSGTYQSWCDKHVELEDNSQHGDSEVCGICYDEMGPYRKLESIRAPCCQNGWFHRRCVAQFAQTAGYFFKCPLCNNKDDFSEKIARLGVYIPEKDAAWELEPNAFGDQLERPSACDAEECRCRNGREYDDCKRWDLIMCATCGSTCRHDQCMEVPSKNYVCTFCRPIVGNEPPAAVLALAEESRRAEAARRAAEAGAGQSSDEDAANTNRSRSRSTNRRSNGRNRRVTSASSESAENSDSSAEVIKPSKRRKRRFDSTDSSTTTSSPVVTSKRCKSAAQRRLSSSSSHSSGSSRICDEAQLQELIRKTPLPRGTSIEKLLHSKPIVKLQKLSEQEIKTLTSSEAEEDACSTGSSTIFDFNFRVKQNKQQRRRSIAELASIKEVVLRSDTDTLTDASTATTEQQQRRESKESKNPKTPSSQGGGKTFAKKFKLKLVGSKTVPRKRSTSESDPEVPAKKVETQQQRIMDADSQSDPVVEPFFGFGDDEIESYAGLSLNQTEICEFFKRCCLQTIFEVENEEGAGSLTLREETCAGVVNPIQTDS